MKKRGIKIAIIVTAAVAVAAVLLLLGGSRLSGTPIEYSTQKPEYAEAQSFTEKTASVAEEKGMSVVAENDSLALLIREKDAVVAILDKLNDHIFFTSPEATDEDDGATAFYKDLMKAALNVTYYNDRVQASEMDSFSKSVSEGQFEIAKTSCGADITYTIGEAESKLLLPEAISEEKFDTVLAKMDEKAAKKVKRNYLFLSKEELSKSDYETYLETYPGIELHNLYILKSGTKDYLKEELAEYFVGAGYTAEELAADREENCGETASAKPWFMITVSYRIENDSFVVEIDPSKITYNEEGYYLTHIDVLPYFGAAYKEQQGYMFVPDGSGALIDIDNGKTDVSYYGKVYGEDITLSSLNRFKTELEEEFSIKMPVYGIKADDTAWISIIEQGAGYADIRAEVSGKTTSYNHVYSGFSYLTYGSVSMGDIVGANSFYMYSKPQFASNYRMRYYFLSGNDADYTGMALRYRKYLVDEGKLTTGKAGTSTPFYAEYIGAIDKTQSTLGIKYDSVVPVTTYSQALEITNKLLESGVSNLSVIYTGWEKGGLRGYSAANISALSKLSRDGLDEKAFADELSEKNVNFYPFVEMQRVERNGFADGYSEFSNAPRYFDRSVVKTYSRVYANGITSKWNVNLVSPYFEESLATRVSKRLQKAGFAGIGVKSLSHVLYSDYDETKYTDREAAIIHNEKALEIVSKAFSGNMLAENSNVYALSYISDMIDVPMYSNNVRIIDRDVPFYQTVIKGCIDFAGAPLNLADDYETAILQAAETGAGLCFEWMYEKNSVIKDTDFDELYSVNYLTWLEKATADWKKINSVCGSLNSVSITDREEIGNVVIVTYENGAKVAVNYGTEDVVADGQIVPARDFVLINE